MVKRMNSLELLNDSDPVTVFNAGAMIFREGDEGLCMFVIKSGRVELRLGTLAIGTFTTGDIIGEMALVDQEARSASARAITDCELVSVNNGRFEKMILDTPEFAVEVMRVMAVRLRHMNRETSIVHKRAETSRILSITDPLTGVYNRRAWDERMDAEEFRCRRLGRSVCVLSIDLDGLKTLNDTLGHAKGDAMIKEAGAALLEACRDTDIVARLGGDEFGVLALDCPLEAGQALVRRINEVFNERGIGASVGLAARDPLRDMKHAWEIADQDMYAVKRERKSARGKS